jgi:hypothetical protein
MEEKKTTHDELGQQNKYPLEDKLRKEIGEVEYTKEAKLSLIDFFERQSDENAQEALRKKTERENEKIKFLGGAEFSWNEIKNIIIPHPQGYDPLFPNDVPFYTEIYRLNKWDDLNPHDFIKPACVAGWTDLLIYDRFPKEVLPAIQVLNSQVMGFIRLYKHYQYLTKDGLVMATDYRDQAIAAMKGCSTWHEFRLVMKKDHNVPYVYQKNMFEERK